MTPNFVKVCLKSTQPSLYQKGFCQKQQVRNWNKMNQNIKKEVVLFSQGINNCHFQSCWNITKDKRLTQRLLQRDPLS